MKKSIIILFIALLAAPVWVAGKEKTPNPGVHSGYGDGRYMLSLRAEYDYNRIWEHGAGFDLRALMPINPHFELETGVQAQTANVYTLAAVARPIFDIPVGQVFMETEALYKVVARAEQKDFCAAISLGYRMDYFRAQVGWFARIIAPFHQEHNTSSSYNTEIANILYLLEVSARPQQSRWNLTATISNMDDYNMERHWQLLFMLGTRFDVTDHIRLTLDAQVKPAGIFHQQALFYGAYARAGFAYKF